MCKLIHMAVAIRWVVVILGGVFAMTTVQRYWPTDWPAWLGFGVSVFAMGTVLLGLPGPRPHGWRLVAAILSSFAAAIASSYVLYPWLIARP